MSIKLEVYDAGGAIEITSKHAPRLNTLSGKIIGELSNVGFESARALSQVSELLKQKFPDIKIIPYTEFPAGEEQLDSEGIGELVKSKGCDGVIVGTAACGT